ncbi:MAG: phytanoyl-CoA dioxygenase family protein [Armatimonadetes bacterium]|nr:phytanoyl-CoA dioxygenase family protein [Armatimonadota bacterium]
MNVDLSARHELVGNLFSIPSTREQLECYRLTEDQVASYERNGYLTGIRLLTEDQVDRLLEELEGLMDSSRPGNSLFYEYHSNESQDPSRVLFHALGAWRITPGFHDILWNPAFTTPASQLLGGAVRFWHDQLFCKPARHGGVVAWHQDYSYWTRTKPLAHLTCWIGLDDSTREDGCVYYVPGSHKWDLLPITGLTGDMVAINEVLTDEQKRAFENPTPVVLKRGECSFHHSMTMHGSFENSTDRPRRATVINAFRDGVASASDEPLLEGVPPVNKGEKMGGQFFPLLFDPNA